MKTTIKMMLFLNLLNFITSKLFIFITTLGIFLLFNYITFGKIDMIIPLLISHFLLYVFVYQNLQKDVMKNRKKLLEIIYFLKSKQKSFLLIDKLI